MRQKLGQHFLTNPAVVKAMAAALEIKSGDTIIEVGPGHGELTQALIAEIETTKGNGAAGGTKLFAIERDPALAEEARQRFKEYPWVRVLEADILDSLRDPETAKDILVSGYKLAGNIPYYLTGHLLRTISESVARPEAAVLMLQKEVAERIVALPPRMNRLAASVQFWAEAKILRVVKRGEFRPPPEVDSAVILLDLRERSGGGEDRDENFYRMVRTIFAQPRKTVLNNLRKGFVSMGASLAEATTAANAVLNDAGVAPDARPQDLSVDSVEKIGKLAYEVDKSQ